MEADIWPLKYIIHQHMIDSVVLESLGGRWDFFLKQFFSCTQFQHTKCEITRKYSPKRLRAELDPNVHIPTSHFEST